MKNDFDGKPERRKTRERSNVGEKEKGTRVGNAFLFLFLRRWKTDFL
jgi:hypothetical protein